MDNKIIEYVIVSWNNEETFEERVNILLKKGYQPYGNPTCSFDVVAGKLQFTQAMVLHGSLEDNY